ncbi:MAG: glycosyltransferase, partial [Flavobacteriales bacterium]
GMLSREELMRTMQAASVFLISSKHETFGVVAIEAMSCGLYVISTPCGGTEDTVRGLGHITDGTQEDFAHAMLQAYANRASHQPQVLHNAMANRFSYEAVASQLKQVYSQLLQSRS